MLILNFSRVLSVRPSVRPSVRLFAYDVDVQGPECPWLPWQQPGTGLLVKHRFPLLSSSTLDLAGASHPQRNVWMDPLHSHTHTPLLCLFDSTNVIWHLNWVREVPVWAQTVDGDSSREPLHYPAPAEATETIRNNKCSMSWWWGVWRKGTNSFRRLKPHILSPFYRRRIFECETCSLSQLHVCSHVSVCKRPLCCVWAVKHPSQQVSIISTSERWTACGFSVCASVWVPALKLPLSVQRKKTLPGGRLTSDSQRCYSQSLRAAGLISTGINGKWEGYWLIGQQRSKANTVATVYASSWVRL